MLILNFRMHICKLVRGGGLHVHACTYLFNEALRSSRTSTLRLDAHHPQLERLNKIEPKTETTGESDSATSTSGTSNTTALRRRRRRLAIIICTSRAASLRTAAHRSHVVARTKEWHHPIHRYSGIGEHRHSGIR